MGCRIFVGHEAGSDIEHACLFDSVTETAFGPFFADLDEADAFLTWWSPRPDPRGLTGLELENAVYEFRQQSRK